MSTEGSRRVQDLSRTCPGPVHAVRRSAPGPCPGPRRPAGDRL